MRTFQLQLKPRTTPLPRLAEAWFIPSTQPRTWLYEAIACQLPLAQLRIHIVPKSTHDLTPSGALLVSTQPFTAGKTCAATPCDKIGNGKLYFPHGAALHPPVTSAELDRALPSPHYFLHPSLGLTAFDTEATLGVMDLIAPPTEIASDWSHSHPGRPTLPRLTSVSLTLSESLEDILGSGREDIGSLDKGTMPKHPSETGLSDKLSHAGGLLGKGVAGIAGIAGAAGALAAGGLLKGMLNFANNTPQTANKRTWVNFLQEWAEKKLANVKFMPQQEKEIERLLHLLETNPDEGLKYALPLNADNARGAGDSSGHLSQHATDFDLRNLGGGQSYSPWDISWQAQQKLTQQYREAANRELRLGRHRRAAYIFAELLNDKSSAADALKQGHHFREAAIIYRDHLRRPLDAAKCFRNAGMIYDAIAIYEAEKQFEVLGDLFRELDREIEATASYRREVVRLIEEKRDLISGARLLEIKLFAPDESLTVLRAGGIDCLREEFALLERLARPDEANSRLDTVTTDTVFPRIIPMINLLSDLSRTYFNPTTRELAKDRARVLAGNNLKKFSTSDQRTILTAIHRTDEHDLLLQRDARRYTNLQQKNGSPLDPLHKKRQPPRPIKPATDSITLVATTKLSSDARWFRTAAWSNGFFIAGFNKNELVLNRTNRHTSQIHVATWPVPPAVIDSIELVPYEFDDVKINVFSGRQFLPQAYYASHAAVSHRSPEPHVLGIASSNLDWSVEVSHDDLALYGRDLKSGDIRTSHSISRLPPGEDREHLIRHLGFIPMIAQKSQVVFAIGLHIGRLFHDKIEWIELDQPILSLRASQPHTKLRLVATHPQGATVIWGDSEWGQTEFIAQDLYAPEASFTRSGRLILAADGLAKTFIAEQGHVHEHSSFSWDDKSQAIGVVGEDLRNFHIFTAEHRYHYRFERL